MIITIQAQSKTGKLSELLRATAAALLEKEAKELLEAFPEGEHFVMDGKYACITITKTEA